MQETVPYRSDVAYRSSKKSVQPRMSTTVQIHCRKR